MVRNPRTLMMCSLLALAMGLALGSQIAPTTANVAAAPAAVPPLAERLEAWVRPQAAVATPSLAPLEATTDAAPDPTLEGGRQPRMPRMSREALARPMR